MKKKLIGMLSLSAFVGFGVGVLLGYSAGISHAIGICGNIAMDFLSREGIHIDKVLILEYLQRVGL